MKRATRFVALVFSAYYDVRSFCRKEAILKNPELVNALVDHFVKEFAENLGVSRSFTPKEISAKIKGSVPTNIGKVAPDVCLILRGRGFKIRYEKINLTRNFIIN